MAIGLWERMESGCEKGEAQQAGAAHRASATIDRLAPPVYVQINCLFRECEWRSGDAKDYSWQEIERIREEQERLPRLVELGKDGGKITATSSRTEEG